MFLFTNFQCNLKGTQLVVTPILEFWSKGFVYFYFLWALQTTFTDSLSLKALTALLDLKILFIYIMIFFLKRLFTIVATGSKLGYFLYLFTVRTSLRCPASANYLNLHHQHLARRLKTKGVTLKLSSACDLKYEFTANLREALVRGAWGKWKLQDCRDARS